MDLTWTDLIEVTVAYRITYSEHSIIITFCYCLVKPIGLALHVDLIIILSC